MDLKESTILRQDIEDCLGVPDLVLRCRLALAWTSAVGSEVSPASQQNRKEELMSVPRSQGDWCVNPGNRDLDRFRRQKAT